MVSRTAVRPVRRGGLRGRRGSRDPRGKRRALVAGARLVLSILAAVCLPSPPIEPAEPDRELERVSPGIDRLQLPSSVQLDLIRPVELVPGGSFAVTFDGHDLSTVSVNSQISRTLPLLWRIDVDPASPTAYYATYELIGADGRPGGLSLTTGDAFVPVTLEPIEPVTTRGVDGSVRMEGGLRLHLSLEGVTRSGNYSGTLIVALHHL